MKVIHTDKAPQAVGPYSQAIQAGDFIFVSGQIPLVPNEGVIVSSEVKEQTIQVLENLKAVIESTDHTLEDVVKCTIFIKDMNDFAVINEVYSKYFSTHKPARACVEVSRLPKDVLVEIEAIVYTKKN